MKAVQQYSHGQNDDDNQGNSNHGQSYLSPLPSMALGGSRVVYNNFLTVVKGSQETQT